MSNKQNDELRERTWIDLRQVMHNTREESCGISTREVSKAIAKEFYVAEMKALIWELDNQIKQKEGK